MDVNALFTQALGMVNPWEVVELKFDVAAKRLDIRVDFAPGSTFPCPVCAVPCKVHDASPQTWRHLNFFEHLTFIEARQPRTNCSEHGVKTATVPWARASSGFTLLFEAMVVELARNGLTVTAIGRIVGEHDTRIWRILEHYVDEARRRADFSKVEKVGVDETSRQKGHVYVTLFADMAEAKVLFVTEGKDHETVARFKEDLVAHGGDPEKVLDWFRRAKAEGGADDSPESVRTRLKIYDDQTAPVIEYYRQHGQLTVVDGVGELDDVFTRILEAIAPVREVG